MIAHQNVSWISFMIYIKTLAYELHRSWMSKSVNKFLINQPGHLTYVFTIAIWDTSTQKILRAGYCNALIFYQIWNFCKFNPISYTVMDDP